MYTLVAAPDGPAASHYLSSGRAPPPPRAQSLSTERRRVGCSVTILTAYEPYH